MRTEEYRQEAVKLLGLTDNRIVLEMRRELRTMAKPIGAKILEAYGSKMPKRGGLAARIQGQGRVSILTDLRRGVRLNLSNKGVYMGAPESGQIRHPVFGRWLPGQKTQPVPPNVGLEAFTAQADELQREVARIVTQTVRRAL